MKFIINFKLPKRMYRKIFKSNYPDISSIVGECLFKSSDTYGIPRGSIYDFINKLENKMIEGHEIEIPIPT